MNNSFEYYKETVENRLKELLDIKETNETLKSAMSYSVMAGGKRLRPIFNIMANGLLDGDLKETLDNACAMEFLHTSSLIHDDLPAMDDDELRRGKPTNHVMFGEAFAILAGDSLLNFTYEVMLKNALRYPDNIKNHVRAMDIVASGAGVHGMMNGQSGDLENEGQILTEKELTYVHEHKTGALIKAALLSGLVLCDPSDKQYGAVETYGANIGLSFQITDDILDIVGDQQKMGKTLGKDEKDKKFTFPTIYGIDECRRIAKEKTEEAADVMSIFGSRADGLIGIARKILLRDK